MLAAAHVTLRSEIRAGGRMDWVGLFLLVPGLSALVLGLMQGEDWGWSSALVLALLIGGAALLAIFGFVEPRVRQALVELRLFQSRNFTVNSVVLGLVQFALTGLTVYGAIWSQSVLGFSPITAGLALLPLTIPVLLVAPFAGRIYDRVGPRWLVASGALLIGASFIWGAIVLDQISYAWIWPGYVALGAGIGLVMTPAMTDALNSAAPALRGQASGVLQTVRQIGGTVGLAIMGTIVVSITNDRAGSADPLTPAVSAAYYVAGGALLVGAALAALLLHKVAASDAAVDGSGAHPTAATPPIPDPNTAP
jgi:predicted MFS family arabinose efflux permease